jgi:hypothetical protein
VSHGFKEGRCFLKEDILLAWVEDSLLRAREEQFNFWRG